ncbi:ubiquitin domain-containing protein DSK2b-like isoform X2 [Phalaenopsis equestris]|uniref:ubiquitin domain-containing protein DSK2b-like isoform X2 n=1 Tax=Phalaenopsis equestris TaxID=78828 RepID=UPI0009E319A3|nr:ubiquitin domain-containing protein DSK2b-like isoform X2 [Phalaenopsis equestris]
MGADGDSCDSSVASGAASPATIHIRCSNGSKFSVQTALDAVVSVFKGLISEKCDVPAEQQRLIYKGRILKDDKTLESYGLESDHTIHLVRGAALSNTSNNTAASPGAFPTNNSAASIGAPPADNNVATGRSPSSNEGGGLGGAELGASFFPGLGSNGLFGVGASGSFGTGLPEFDQMQQQLTQNPNMMRDLMNMPAIQNLVNNPDLMRNLIMSNPQMREILDRNPDLAHVLNDPSTLRQTLEAARNPELMREMMRNTDRAMSNIESSPEGFNMLRRMYETVQEPFLNATTMEGNAGSGAGLNPFAALLGNQGSTQSRGSTNSSTASPDSANGSPSPNTNPLPNPWNNNAGGTQENTRSTTGGDGRTGNIAGLGGLGAPELERMAAGLPDSSVFNQVLQNPAMSQMMQSLLSNPQYINQIFNMNPQLRSMMESNTQLREMMQNPEFLRQLASPETLQQILTLQQSLSSMFGRQQSNQGQNQTSDATGMEFLMQMFGGLGAGGNLGVPNNHSAPPEELYATQLAQLQEMGFFDTQENIRALIASSGNVHAAVERLLGNLGH